MDFEEYLRDELQEKQQLLEQSDIREEQMQSVSKIYSGIQQQVKENSGTASGENNTQSRAKKRETEQFTLMITSFVFLAFIIGAFNIVGSCGSGIENAHNRRVSEAYQQERRNEYLEHEAVLISSALGSGSVPTAAGGLPISRTLSPVHMTIEDLISTGLDSLQNENLYAYEISVSGTARRVVDSDYPGNSYLVLSKSLQDLGRVRIFFLNELPYISEGDSITITGLYEGWDDPWIDIVVR